MSVTVSNLERWVLFSLIIVLASALELICWLFTDLSGEEEYRHMIRVSVRLAWPMLIIVFVTSALGSLWPGTATTWLGRNRKYIGLAFSAVMLWQIFFIILLMRTGANIFPPGPAVLIIVSDLIGYTLLLLMTLTSFEYIKRRLSFPAWKRLHKIGVYYIWAIYLYSFPIGIYFSRNVPEAVVGYSILFLITLGAGGFRLVAWKKRQVPITTSN